MSRFPEHLPTDLDVSEVDLDNEQVTFRGERLTDARAEAVVDEVLKRTYRDGPPPDGPESPGQPSSSRRHSVVSSC
jgi:hypothetical protein